MVHKTEAIVLSLQRHSDRAHIVHAYAREGGRLNFMVYGVGGKRKPTAVYNPLSIIEVTATMTPNMPPVVKEAQLMYVPQESRLDMRRQSVSLFIAEVLYRVLRHPMTDETMYRFVEQYAREVWEAEDIENVHLRFLVGFAAALGIGIDAETDRELLIVPHGRKERQKQILSLCRYFQEHLDDFTEPKSLDVLMELFD